MIDVHVGLIAGAVIGIIIGLVAWIIKLAHEDITAEKRSRSREEEIE